MNNVRILFEINVSAKKFVFERLARNLEQINYFKKRFFNNLIVYCG